MKKLSEYNNTTVKITCTDGSVFTGPCEWIMPEDGLDLFNKEQESLRIGDTYFFADYIEDIEMIRNEIFIPVRDWPEATDEIAEWFHERWGIPAETYLESIRECLGHGDTETLTEKAGKGDVIPQWYVVVRGNAIIAGCGVIENDFHERTDLAPNVCAVYVDEGYRKQGVAGFMLESVCKDMADLGIGTLYLLTDHVGFYERYGWEFYEMVRGSDGEQSRMYIHDDP